MEKAVRTFDRIILATLALGVWALVLSPQSIEAHHARTAHDCSISGTAFGQADQNGAYSIDASGFNVQCDHRIPAQTY
jgi:hypothetical protein